MLFMSTVYGLYTIMYMCAVYILLFVCLTVYACALRCILFMYVGYVPVYVCYAYILCMPCLCILPKFVHPSVRPCGL